MNADPSPGISAMEHVRHGILRRCNVRLSPSLRNGQFARWSVLMTAQRRQPVSAAAMPQGPSRRSEIAQQAAAVDPALLLSQRGSHHHLLSFSRCNVNLTRLSPPCEPRRRFRPMARCYVLV